MRAQERGLVDVVGVGAGAADVVGRETERVKVLDGANDGVELIVALVGGCWELGLDDLAGDGNGVVFLKVKLAAGESEDSLGDVVPFVGGVGLAIDLDGGGSRAVGGGRRGRWRRGASSTTFLFCVVLESEFG